MLMKGGYYEADLTDLPSGDYTFTATVKDKNLSRSGGFTILDFDVEQQFLSSDYIKLGRLAERTQGKLFFPAETKDLVAQLMAEEQFVPIQKSKQNVVSLIDFQFLFRAYCSCVGCEWFIRKYNGLI